MIDFFPKFYKSVSIKYIPHGNTISLLVLNKKNGSAKSLKDSGAKTIDQFKDPPEFSETESSKLHKNEPNKNPEFKPKVSEVYELLNSPIADNC